MRCLALWFLFSACAVCADPLDQIKHIVVLMLENRSFDNLLGKLYPKSERFDGLSGQESNCYDDGGTIRTIQVWNGQSPRLPTPDPNENFVDMNEQLFGTQTPVPGAAPDMSGFAQNYFRVTNPAPPDGIMHYFRPEQVPVISELARSYAVCDGWFASCPCQTWPNRFFVHTATAGGYENNAPVHFPYRNKTIFTRFDELGRGNEWKIYYHDFPESAVLSELWLHADRFQHFSEFKKDAAAGTLPSYSFIEPCYYAEVTYPSDQHPPHDVRFGEALIAEVYNALQSSPNWKETLFILIYDEHGGCYDHVPPPAAVMPEAPSPEQVFAFNRYGVRIPAVVISPRIAPGTIFRAPEGVAPFDHTSVIATVRRCFGLGGPLTARDAQAPDLGLLLTLSDDELNLGAPIPLPVIDQAPQLLDTLKQEALTRWQKSLHTIAAHLPNLSEVEQKTETVLRWIEGGLSGVEQELAYLDGLSPSEAYAKMKEKWIAFLDREEEEF